MEIFITTLTSLISVMNPLGTVPIFVSLTKEHLVPERNKIALKTSLNVLVILIISFFMGKFILIFFGITLDSLKIAGGLIISLSGFSLLTGEFVKHKGMKKDRVKKDIQNREDISLTPLALPMIAGPGAISLLITYHQEYQGTNNILFIIAAVVISVIIILLILRCSFLIVKLLGASGINALSRIIGFIVVAIGVEFMASAVKSLFHLV